MAKVTKYNNLVDLPFHEIQTQADVTEFLEKYQIKPRAHHLYPQLLAHIAQFRVERHKDFLVNYSPLQVLLDNVKGNPFNEGLIRFIRHSPRGDTMHMKQISDGAHYCALVPLFLAAFKKFHNIPYSMWHVDELKYVVDKDLYEAMTCTVPDLSSEQLLELRDQALMTMTGPKAGTPKDARTTYALHHLKDTPLADVPKLAKIMLLQTWCAHPANRNEYMILDPRSWNAMPEPLIPEALFTEPKVEQISDFPWK